MTVLGAAKTGDRRQALEAMRDALARAMDDAEPNMLPQISGQLRAVLNDLAGVHDTREVDPLDEITKAREARLAKLEPKAKRKAT